MRGETATVEWLARREEEAESEAVTVNGQCMFFVFKLHYFALFSFSLSLPLSLSPFVVMMFFHSTQGIYTTHACSTIKPL